MLSRPQPERQPCLDFSGHRADFSGHRAIVTGASRDAFEQWAARDDAIIDILVPKCLIFVYALYRIAQNARRRE
jgi:hypothetical protein